MIELVRLSTPALVGRRRFGGRIDETGWSEVRRSTSFQKSSATLVLGLLSILTFDIWYQSSIDGGVLVVTSLYPLDGDSMYLFRSAIYLP
jgi:hypothetical protein